MAKKTVSKKTGKKAATKKKASPRSPKGEDATKAKDEGDGNGVVVADAFRWIPAEKGYSLALKGKKLYARNAKGKKLASVPAAVKKTELAEQLLALRDWLVQHRQECTDSVETWMLRSLPVPRDALASVWIDEAWRGVLENLVVAPMAKSEFDQDRAGFLRGVDAKKGIGVVDLDGETQWLKTQTIAIPHPILLDELSDFRELATELDLKQATDQLFRETWKFGAKQFEGTHTVRKFEGGQFQMLSHANSAARARGYRVRGGSATCTVFEGGTRVEARYWIGEGEPEYETWTGDLSFVNSEEKAIELKNVGPVAFSEGMRMAASIYSKRFIEEEKKES
ncbi:MAG: DUF4132 domain-containing protein [Planctomycetaceae bacterium]